MCYWWVALGINLVFPLLMITIGVILCKYPPKKINKFYGHRTAFARKNMDTWTFANMHSGKNSFLVGLISFIPSALVLIPFYLSSEKVISIVMCVVLGVQLCILLCTIFATEIALRKAFNSDGTRREKTTEEQDK